METRGKGKGEQLTNYRVCSSGWGPFRESQLLRRIMPGGE